MKNKKTSHIEEARDHPFPIRSDHKTARHRLTICQDKPKSTKEVLLWNVSKKSTGGLKIVSKFHKLFPVTEQNVLQSLK